VKSDDLVKVLSAGVFRLFAIRLSTGDEYRIAHPDRVLVDRSAAVTEAQGRDGSRCYEKLSTCWLIHIVRLVPLEETEVR